MSGISRDPSIVVVVIKRNSAGRETWRYQGRVIKRSQNSILLEAYFNRPDLPFHGLVFKEGDRFVEIYFNNRWYNIYEIHDRRDDQLKGWYCNITYPAEISDSVISYIDLALDLLVYPDGHQLVLDEDEFDELDLALEVRQRAQLALAELQTFFKPPLDPHLENWLE